MQTYILVYCSKLILSYLILSYLINNDLQSHIQNFLSTLKNHNTMITIARNVNTLIIFTLHFVYN